MLYRSLNVKKILYTSIALAIALNANPIKEDYLDCAESFENCMVKCANSDAESLCVEKCEMLFDKCMLEKEANLEINLNSEDKEN